MLIGQREKHEMPAKATSDQRLMRRELPATNATISAQQATPKAVNSSQPGTPRKRPTKGTRGNTVGGVHNGQVAAINTKAASERTRLKSEAALSARLGSPSKNGGGKIRIALV